MRAFFIALLFASACVRAGQKTADVRRVIEAARQQGALTCAPKELALAEAHADFADIEYIAGNHLQALAQKKRAFVNAEAARAHSPAEKCNPLASMPGDRDHDGVRDDEDKCPDDPEDIDGFEDLDGCPDPDNDKDGIPDNKDACPNQAEDLDGFQDADGCPDLDNDKDGVPDLEDLCPNEAGPKEGRGCPDKDSDGDGVVDRLDLCPEVAGAADNQGCPKTKLVNVRADKLELTQKIHFANNAAKILPDSFAMLDEIAGIFKARPTLRVAIEGHTDNRGSDAANLKLSTARADAVSAYLVAKGVQNARLQARGLGATLPIADNKSPLGREKNRRVEFIITGNGN